MAADPGRFRQLRGAVLRKRRLRLAVFAVIIAAALAVNIWTSLNLTDSVPDDAKVYSHIAVNVLENGIYSTDTEPPLKPTIIRVPGYPLFLGGIYKLFGVGNDNAVRVAQGLLNVGTGILAALVAWNWTAGKRGRRRKAAIWSFLLTAFCPFLINYTSVLLTEILTVFLVAAMSLAATYAIRSKRLSRSIIWWLAAGLLGGAVAQVRPDGGLFAAGVGVTLVVAGLARLGLRTGIGSSLEKGAVFTLIFLLVLVPWTIRNERVFGLFQPIAPGHAEMPDEFVPQGYNLWLRTWVDDFKYVDPFVWSLEQKRLDINQVPTSAFTNDDETARVAALIDQYNNSDPDHPMLPSKKPVTTGTDDSDESADSDSDSKDEEPDSDDSDTNEAQDEELNLQITPEVDAQFAEIARERISADPLRFYLTLPAKRSTSMWFDTHSEYYPFAGEMFPIDKLDSETHQNIWLPIFDLVMWLYTLFAFLGLVLLFQRRTWIWAVFVLVIAVPRAAFLGTLENPEPRYLMELFLYAAILAGIAMSHFSLISWPGRFGLTINYGKRRAKSV
jgi:hypothetical protein